VIATRAASPRPSPRAAARARLLACIFAFNCSLACLDVRAQTPPPAPPDEELITVRTDFVLVPFVVTDARGRRVAGLTQADFAAQVDGRTVPVSYFAAGAQRVALLFALDASGSILANVARQRETALALYARFGANSRVAVLTFTERPLLAQPFTPELATARAAFNVAPQPDRHTAIFDAALAAVRAFDEAQLSNAERRIVVLISDGLDTASATRAGEVVAAANARGVTLYVIHLPLFTAADNRLVVRRPARGFRDLGPQTGGQYFLVGDARNALDPRAAAPDLAPVFETIAADLQSQYVLGFYPPADARTGQHQIKVSITSTPARKLRLRQLREGYKLEP
jgi:VWFA-related protein